MLEQEKDPRGRKAREYEVDRIVAEVDKEIGDEIRKIAKKEKRTIGAQVQIAFEYFLKESAVGVTANSHAI